MRRVRPSASKRSSRSCAVRRETPERVAEAGQGDRRERLQRLAAALVERLRDCEPVSDPLQLPLALEEGGEAAVLDAHQVFGGELRLELGCRRRVVAQLRGGARRVGLSAAALDVEEGRDRCGPWLRRQQLGEGNAGIERRARGPLGQALANGNTQRFKPLRSEEPVARLL